MRAGVPFIEPRFNRGAKFSEMADEKMVGAFDNHKALGLGYCSKQLDDNLRLAELVVPAVDDELGFLAGLQKCHVKAIDRNSEADQFRDAGIVARDSQANPCSKTESCEQDRPPGKFSGEVIERRANIILFTAAFVVDALAETHAAKIESENRHAAFVESFRGVKDNLIVHRAAEHRMRMAHDGDDRRISNERGPKESLESPGGSCKKQGLMHHARHLELCPELSARMSAEVDVRCEV